MSLSSFFKKPIQWAAARFVNKAKATQVADEVAAVAAPAIRGFVRAEKPGLLAAIDAEAARLKAQTPATAVDVRDRFVTVARNEAQSRNVPGVVIDFLTVALDMIPLPAGNVLDPAANIDALAAKAKGVIEAL